MSTILKVTGLEVGYGPVRAVKGVNLVVREGEVRVILGANGAGKSSILKAIVGLVKPRAGTIEFPEGREIQGLPAHRINRLGLGLVPEGRQVFATLSVHENLLMGAFARNDRDRVRERLEHIYRLFPVLWQRHEQSAGSLSGGEQQMLAIGRALMSEPRLLLMDEPSLGLAPRVVDAVFELVREINGAGISILLVEQNARKALKAAHWAYLLEVGQMVRDGDAEEIQASEDVRRVYLGG